MGDVSSDVFLHISHTLHTVTLLPELIDLLVQPLARTMDHAIDFNCPLSLIIIYHDSSCIPLAIDHLPAGVGEHCQPANIVNLFSNGSIFPKIKPISMKLDFNFS